MGYVLIVKRVDERVYVPSGWWPRGKKSSRSLVLVRLILALALLLTRYVVLYVLLSCCQEMQAFFFFQLRVERRRAGNCRRAFRIETPVRTQTPTLKFELIRPPIKVGGCGLFQRGSFNLYLDPDPSLPTAPLVFPV